MIANPQRLRSALLRSSKPAWQRINRAEVQTWRRQVTFVAGVHRSGTNMLMDILEQSWLTDVYHETDRRAFDRFMMREPEAIRRLVEASPSRIVVVKALHEAHDLLGLMGSFAPAQAIWMFRHYDDMINSNMANWPGGRNQIEMIVRDRDGAGWRGRGMTDHTHDIVCRHYRPGMNDASALGLFWFYRNQLFFDQGLESDPRALALRYEALVAEPRRELDRLAEFLGIKRKSTMARLISPGSVGKRRPPDIDPAVRALCDTMLDRLVAAAVARGL